MFTHTHADGMTHTH